MGSTRKALERRSRRIKQLSAAWLDGDEFSGECVSTATDAASRRRRYNAALMDNMEVLHEEFGSVNRRITVNQSCLAYSLIVRAPLTPPLSPSARLAGRRGGYAEGSS